MVTVLFVLALCSFAVMGVFLWVLSSRHRRRQEAEAAASHEPSPLDRQR
ncbi:MAG: hypothetical protein MUF60_07575 [Vicinamibacterales bacterium]|jgi:hypothetical protein|nr:hypothetical protein [Vicinamibacterales bacterium]